uniref:cell division FtsA domain-containing protein n=1 Tax=Roseburia inulinivorans TaxID=360807 RepID=UPI0040385317
MNETQTFEQPYVFGLDIGTRNVVGTVGYKEGNEFIVVAQYVMQHETRAMIDGQIHDIGRVGKVIQTVKEELEKQIECPLTEVCIAAAGRVLKTVTTNVEYEYLEETVVTKEDIHTLDLLGIEKAQSLLKEKNDTRYKFYCVGYSVVKYYLNEEVYSNIEGHKAEVISEDIIVTFLPEDVVDGLYSAVAQAGLEVANMTLEPIAAIDVAIPESFRILNIALVDVGAGTSDISVTKDGSIIAYGMIPLAGDELTELIVQHYLVDFQTAERIKLASTTGEMITYKDIMMIEHSIPAKEVWELIEPVTDKMTTAVAEKIKELNGGQTVSATFVVGGGGKIHGYTEMLADKLGLPQERVALRGEEVLQEVTFEQPDIEKDPLIVTPIGICLNYYDQKNSFIMVHLNGERIKMYDNNKLLIMDAALQAGVANEDLFPKRGKEVNYPVNGVAKVERGLPGESAVITMNGKPAGINTKLEPNSEIEICPSTAGADAMITIEQLEEYHTSTITFIVNGRKIVCPRFVEVNGKLEPASYLIKEGYYIETSAYFTVEQIAEFMDVEIDTEKEIIVNNRVVDLNYFVYENFNIEWTILSFRTHVSDTIEEMAAEGIEETADTAEAPEENVSDSGTAGETEDSVPADDASVTTDEETQTAEESPADNETSEEAKEKETHSVEVIINGTPVTLTGRESYMFVDLFEFYEFDLSASAGRAIITKLNGQNAQYTAELKDGDVIELAWKEK